MSTEFIHLITITGLGVIAGLVGFVVGGCLEMRKRRKPIEVTCLLEVVETSGKNSEHDALAA